MRQIYSHTCIYDIIFLFFHSADLCQIGTPIFNCPLFNISPFDDETSFGLFVEFELFHFSQPADKFILEWLLLDDAQDDDWTKALSTEVSSDRTQHLIEDVDTGSWYTARVRGTNVLGFGPWCESPDMVRVVRLPLVAESLVASIDSQDTVCIEWMFSDSEYGGGSVGAGGSGDEDSLWLERSKGDVAGVKPLYTQVTGYTSWCFNDDLPGSSWTYRVQRCNTAGCSLIQDSPEATVYVPNRMRVVYTSAKSCSSICTVSVLVAGFPEGIDSVDLSIPDGLKDFAQIVLPSAGRFSVRLGQVAFELILGPSPTPDTVDIVVRASFVDALGASQISEMPFVFDFFG